MKKNVLISFFCLSVTVCLAVYFASCKKTDDLSTVTNDTKSYDELFSKLHQIKHNSTDVSNEELLEVFDLMQIENPTYAQTEEALTKVEKLSSDDKKKLYYQIGKSSLKKQEESGIDIRTQTATFNKYWRAFEQADLESKSKYGLGIYDLESTKQDALIEEYLKNNNDLQERGYCSYESFPKGLRGISTSRYYNASSTYTVRNSSNILDCDTKVLFPSNGYAWTSTSSTIISFINNKYNGILNSQNSTHTLVGQSKILYGLFDSDLKKHLKLAY